MVRCCAIFAARTPDTGNTTGRPLAAAVRWLCQNLTAYNSGSVTPSDAGGSWRIIVAFPLAAYGYAKTTQWACGERNVPVMLGIQLSRCWVIIIDYQAKSVKIVSRIFLISSGTYSNALYNASA